MNRLRPRALPLLLAAVLLLTTACDLQVSVGTPTTAPTSSPAEEPVVEGGEEDEPDETVPKASGAFPQSQSRTGERVDTVEFLNMVIQHADNAWVPYFESLGLEEPMVEIVYVGSAATPTFLTTCDLNGNNRRDDRVTPDAPNAWYCPTDSAGSSDGAIILPVQTFSDMWDGSVFGQVSERGGDFAAATVAAHEFGHHVADELAKQLGTPQEFGSKNPELIADCFAGIWAAAANADNYLEEGDLEEGVSAMVSIGTNGSKTHGSAEERATAFLTGWHAELQPYACAELYWPSMARRLATR